MVCKPTSSCRDGMCACCRPSGEMPVARLLCLCSKMRDATAQLSTAGDCYSSIATNLTRRTMATKQIAGPTHTMMNRGPKQRNYQGAWGKPGVKGNNSNIVAILQFKASVRDQAPVCYPLSGVTGKPSSPSVAAAAAPIPWLFASRTDPIRYNSPRVMSNQRRQANQLIAR